MGTKKGGKVRGIHKSARRSSENGGRPIGTKVQMQRDISVKILKGTSSSTDGLTKNQIIRLQKKAEKLEAMKKAQEGLQAVHILSEEVESLKSNWLKAFKAKEYEAKNEASAAIEKAGYVFQYLRDEDTGDVLMNFFVPKPASTPTTVRRSTRARRA
jgi:hypothetical protein